MHTFEADDDFRIHHNGDYSGDVTIVHDKTKQEMTVPFTVLVEFVAHFVRGERISKLENASFAEVLGVEKIP